MLTNNISFQQISQVIQTKKVTAYLHVISLTEGYMQYTFETKWQFL